MVSYTVRWSLGRILHQLLVLLWNNDNQLEILLYVSLNCFYLFIVERHYRVIIAGL